MKNQHKVKITFWGATGTVTGSKYLIAVDDHKILIDCGLFQGAKELRKKNREQLPVKANNIDLILLTHGHLDHIGYLPLLVKRGFKGKIYGTQPTLDVSKIMLLDSSKSQEEEARKANQEGSQYNPATPLYELKDATSTIDLFKPIPEGKWINLFNNIRVRFQYNGHIIGSVFIEIDVYGKRLVFSGDVGRKTDFLLYPPKKPQYADILIIESTYGDQIHPELGLKTRLKEIINSTLEKSGTIIIPSLIVERAPLLMYLLWELQTEKAIPAIPMFLDSPMGANMVKLFHKHEKWHKLSKDHCIRICNSFKMVKSLEETKEVIHNPNPKVIIVGSGMLSDGRVLTYLQHYISKPETTVLLAGYQAEGTRGRALIEGSKELIIYGKEYPVKAKLFDLYALSSHADQRELLDWISEIKGGPEKVIITHGEEKASSILEIRIRDAFKWDCLIPDQNATIELGTQ